MISFPTSIRSFGALLALSLAAVSISQPVFAGTLNPNQLPSVMMTVAGTSAEWNYTPPQGVYKPAADGGFETSEPLHYYNVCDNRANVEIREIQFDPDPFVLNNILVTNTTAATQIFSVFVGLPTTFAGPNIISGNITTTVLDGDLSGSATVSSSLPNPIYQARIDGAGVANLQVHPFSLTTATSTSASAAFGPTANALPVTASIGIQLTFQLTAGDTAAILSRFEVIPEPSSILLCGVIAILGLQMRRR